MANPEGARKTGEAIVVSTVPDVCLTPVGCTTVPVPYQITANFRNSASISPNVKFAGNRAFLLDMSIITTVTGDEPGTAGGVRSGTNLSIVKPIEASSTVKVNKKRVVRHNDKCEMNNGNTIGRVVYQKGGSSGTAIGKNGKPNKDTTPPGFRRGLYKSAKNDWGGIKEDSSTLWDATGFSSATHDQASAARGRIWEGVKGVGRFLDTVMKSTDPMPSCQSHQATAELAQIGKTAYHDAGSSFKQNYSEGGMSQVAGAATWGTGKLVAQALTTKGLGKMATVTKEASALKKSADVLKRSSMIEKTEKDAVQLKRLEEAALKEKKAAEDAGKAKKKEGVKVRPKKIREIKPKCFKPGKDLRKAFKNDIKKMEKEFYVQLKRQEEGLNKLTVKEFLENLEKFEAQGRGSGSAQEKARKGLSTKIQKSIEGSLKNKGIIGESPKKLASERTKSAMEKVAALHEPDMSVGGHDKIGGFGDARVNSSIGSQWDKDNRTPDMKREAHKALKTDGPDAKMNVKLERCK